MSGIGVPLSSLIGPGIGWNPTANNGAGQFYVKLGYNLALDANGNIIASSTGNANSIAVSTPASGIAGAAQTVSGTYTGNAPTGFSYAVDGGTSQTAVSPTIGNGQWSFPITAPAAGPHSVTVTGTGANTGSATSAVFTNTAADSITVATPASGVVAGATLTIGGAYVGTVPTGFSYSIDGAAPATAGSPTISGGTYSFQITAPSAGAHTIAVTPIGSAAATVTSAAFTTVAAGSPAITVNTPASAIAGATMTISGTYSNGVPSGFSYRLDGGAAVAATAPTISAGAYSFQVPAPAAGTHYISVYASGGNTGAATSGNFTTTSTNAADGSTLAPAGTAQHPTLLQGYRVRPSWNVAGVDYAVGYPAGQTLTDWQAMSGAGITVNATATPPTVTVNGQTNPLISGVDFSLHGGAQLVFLACTNPTVQNCNFGGVNLASVTTGVIYGDAATVGLTAKYNVVDGAGPGTASNDPSCLVFHVGSGDVTLQYNWFKHFPCRVLELHGTIGNLDYRWNLLESGGWDSRSHLNCLEWDGGGNTGSITIAYNTLYQGNGPAVNGEGFQFYSNAAGGCTITNPTVANNTLISLPSTTLPASISYFLHGTGAVAAGAGPVTLNGTATCENNYVDQSGAYGTFYTGSVNSWTISGNIDMSSGATLAAGSPTIAITSVTPVVAGGASTVTGWFAEGEPTSLTATVDGATVALSNVVITSTGGSGPQQSGTFSATFTTPTAGSHTLAISGVNYNSTSASFPFTSTASGAPSLTVATPVGAVAGASQTIDGTYANGTPATLTYSIDGGAAQTATGATISGGIYSFTITAPSAGAHTITVSGTGGNTASATSASFTNVASNTLTVNTPATTVAGASMVVSGTYAGAAPTGFTYTVDGGASQAAPSPTIGNGTWNFAIGAPAAGSHTIDVIGTGPNTASATSGSFTTTASLTVPGAPGAPTAGTITSTSIALSWTAPGTGGAPTSYTLQQSPHGTNTWTTVATGITGTTYTVTGLTAATDYDFQVAAVNSAGTGAYGTNSTGVTTSASYADGLSGAPAGVSAQLPNALSGYSARPPWHVAGVDYGVGVPAATTLTDWQALTGTGITVSTSGNYVRVDSTANVTIQNVDFTLHNGAYLFFVGSASAIVQNCKFGGANLSGSGQGVISADSASTNLTVQYCAFNGSANPGDSVIYVNGGATIEYNLFAGFTVPQINAANSGTYTVKFNLFEDGFVLHTAGGTSAFDVGFNTMVTQSAAAQPAGIDLSNATLSSGTPTNLNYNTLVAALANSEGWMLHGATATGTANMHDNWIDPTGSYGPFYGGSFSGWTISNNTDLATDTALTNSP